MSLNVLISDPDKEYVKMIQKCLTDNFYLVDFALNGKEAQLKCYNKKYFAVILDVDTQNNSGFEVLRYFRVNAPSVKILLTISGKKRMKELDISEKDLHTLGVSNVLVKPYKENSILKSLNGDMQFDSHYRKKNREEVRTEEEILERDDRFTRVKIEEFFSGNSAIFDLYIKINPNRYLKILCRGDFFQQSRVDQYKKERELKYLYFKTKDRSVYINYINQLVTKVLAKPKIDTVTKLHLVKNVTEKYIEEIYTEGLRPALVEESTRICDNLYKLITSDNGLKKLLAEFNDKDYGHLGHSFLVAFLSSMLASQLEWVSRSTTQRLVMGGILHDIGFLKIDDKISRRKPHELTKEELVEYQKHPVLGVEMVGQFNVVSTEVKQIILQHHETSDGLGYTQGLNGIKIYPLAQVLGFVESCVEMMELQRISPVKALKLFLQNDLNLAKFDRKVIKAFAHIFINKVA